MSEALKAEGNGAQAYLAALALPEELVSRSRHIILARLTGTDFADEVRKML